MHAFTVHPPKEPASADPPRRRWRRWAAVLLLLLGLGGLVWALRPDPHLARAKELQKELFGPAGKGLAPDERKARFAELRDNVKRLNTDQKWELSAPMRERQRAEMDRYFAMSPKEKAAYLDEHINRSEKMRKEREQRAAQGNGGNRGGGPPGASGGGRPRSPDDIEQRLKQALERTTPDERARADQFRKEMNDRRRQRGLPVRA